LCRLGSHIANVPFLEQSHIWLYKSTQKNEDGTPALLLSYVIQMHVDNPSFKENKSF
jgi:hypothetical protein